MTPEAIRSGFKSTGVYPPNEGVDKLKQTTRAAGEYLLMSFYDKASRKEEHIGITSTSGDKAPEDGSYQLPT